MKNKMFAALGWLQLIVSLLLAAAIIWGYITYQASYGQFVGSVAASVEAVSNVVVRTAETVEARRELLDQTAQMLVVTRKLINELRVAAENQAKLAPQYADGARSASTVAGNLSNTFRSIGTELAFSVPTGFRFEGMKPAVVMSQPLAKQAEKLIQNAHELRVISESLSGAATTISRDGPNLSVAIIATSDQALKVITETEKTLGRINTQDLPKAVGDLKTTSTKLREVSAQIDIVGNLGVVLLVVGLLLSTWCFLSSLGAISLANTKVASELLQQS